ncbi:MAG: hypothetical protein J7K96_06905 [Desulfobacteraceae bacterium]|nr:hypothetical protein [Desulfobacteraceae bacterium]
MNDQFQKQGENQKKSICYRDGRFYFTKQAERTFFFVMTIIMLVAGVLYKTGIL